jgi:predicted PurR-regulated permease PerM
MFGMPKPQPVDSDGREVPPGIALATDWAWRILVIGGAVAVLLFVLVQLNFIVIPLLVAVLLAALASPLNELLLKLRFPRWLATVSTLVIFLSVVTALVWLVINEVIRGWEKVLDRIPVIYDDLAKYLLDSPLEISETQLRAWFTQVTGELEINSTWLLNGALSFTSSIGAWLLGFGIAVFALVFFIHEGQKIWGFVAGLFPKDARGAVFGAGLAGWGTLLRFVRVQVFVAFVDAVGIGLGALILGLPLVVPIAVAVFLGGFVPFIGATVTGAFAVLVALVFEGPFIAFVMLIIVVAVQQIESQIIQPLVMGKAVKIHPLGVVVAVAVGGYFAGIPGVLFAVPVVALGNVVVQYLASGAWRTDPVATGEIQKAKKT